MDSQQQHSTPYQSDESAGVQPSVGYPQASASFYHVSQTGHAHVTSPQHPASLVHQPAPGRMSHNTKNKNMNMNMNKNKNKNNNNNNNNNNSSGCGQGTAAFLRDFNLVAEAAKRAQMAVIARDLESVSL
ncbi:hypothetical protein GX48_02660 [Paracoccidioides brasiliensis]|nr:hypothetical protein GX48_02660 [Paracoccidioides brasiliensis]